MWRRVTGIVHVIPYAGTVVAAAAVGIATLRGNGEPRRCDHRHGGDRAAIAAAIGMGLATWMQGQRGAHEPRRGVHRRCCSSAWLWGGWGLLLGVPILAVIKSIADRVEAMQPVSELLSP